jgi:hypothetical protein
VVDREHALDRVALQPLHRLDRLAGVVAADADHDRHAAGHHRHGALDDPLRLLLVDGGALPGRPKRDHPGDADLHVVVDEPLVGAVVDLAAPSPSL